ncbi:MAG: hypothetical protein CMP62_00025 [Flavobacteriales bacterium]|nr:hypothetical protein [Flavobacteriales bacterium]
MRENFLFKISSVLFSEYADKLSELVIVLPSRRSSIFLSQEFSQFISRPIWLPKFFSIEDFIFSVNNLNRVSSLELFFEFYSVYKQHVDNPHTLERSYKWAGTLLEDFNEIDKSYANYSDLFDYLSDVKRIENWYLDINSSKNKIDDYLSFFKKFNVIYKSLKKNLLDKNIAYSGLAQRILVDQLDQIKLWLKKQKKQKIIFIGLDALTISQEKIIDYLISYNLCDIFWDTDEYFVNNRQQESGKFIRKYIKKWPQKFIHTDNAFLNKKKEIEIIGVTKNVNQAKLLGSLLKKKKYNKKDIKKVGVILANEDLLLPVLESIPNQIQNINITMGYKLSHHPIVAIFYDLLSLYSSKKINTTGAGSTQYLNQYLFQFFNNPYFQLLLLKNGGELNQELIHKLKFSNSGYTGLDEIEEIMSSNNNIKLNSILFGEINTGLEVIISFLNVTEMLLDFIGDDNEYQMIEKECLLEIEQSLLVFKLFLEKSNEKINISLFKVLFQNIIRSLKLHFSGEPLNGIQIMGLLESRTIDFDEVFILSSNESYLPPPSKTNSFIPFDVKLKFNIRTALDLDAIYANHFFNLIKRPIQTHIIYNQDTSYSGERSRFINQLVYEFKPIAQEGINIREHLSVDKFFVDKASSPSIFDIKDNYILNKLLSICRSGLSPSTINMYNYCKTQFYFEKIIGVSAPKDEDGILEGSKIGSVIHRVLERLYYPYLNIYLDNQIMKNIKNLIVQEIKSALDYYHIKNIKTGKNVIAIAAITRIVENFISHESEQVSHGNKIMIKFLEHETPTFMLKTNLFNEIKIDGEINLKGHIDRIDIFNDCYRIIDYKTGFVKNSDLQIEQMEEISSSPKVLQLLLYAWLFWKESKKKHISILAGVINLRAKSFEFNKCCVNKTFEISNDTLIEFENQLEKIFFEMFNPEQGFQHLDRQDKCRFCD